jgi:hypothetical protein
MFQINAIHARRIALMFTLAASAAANAQTSNNFGQSNAQQQQSIQQGLQSGGLNTKEAAKLEGQQSKNEKMESRALRDGTVSASEQARIDARQQMTAQNIQRQSTDAQRGRPNSNASQNMQADVARNINQQQRIGAGMADGSLSNREASRLQHGQSQVNAAQNQAGRNRHIRPWEQRSIQSAQNRQSRQIARDRRNG